ncbi:MAG: hypothetical protein ACFFBC_00285 [Promethearchaeota archaeon]
MTTMLTCGALYFLLFHPIASITVVLVVLTPFLIYSIIMYGVEFQRQLKGTSDTEKRELLKDNFEMKLIIGGGLFVFIYWILFSMLNGTISVAPIVEMRNDLIALFSELL